MARTKSSVHFTLHEKSEHAADGKYSHLLPVLSAWLMFMGLGECFIITFSLPCLFWVLALAAFCVIVGLEALQKDTKKLFLAFCAATAGSLLVWALAAKYTRAGITIISNAITRISSVNNLQIIPQYEVSITEGSWATCVTLFFFPLAVLLAVLCDFAVRHDIVAFPLVSVAVMSAVMITFKSYSGAAWLLPVFLVICMMICHRSGDSSAGFSLLLPTVVLLLGCVMLWLCSPGGSGISAYFSAKKTEAEHKIHMSSYESAEQTLTEGRLKDATRFNSSGTTALTVTLKKPCSMYLRGFTGGTLTQDGWKALSGEEFYDFRALFYNLHKNGFFPESQMNTLAFALDYADDSNLYDMEIAVNNACRAYVYTPYEFCSAQEDILPADILGDSTARVSENGTYHYSVQPRLAIKYPLLATRYWEYANANVSTEAFTGYFSAEERYRAFVYEHYLDINGELSDVLEKHIAKGAEIGESHLAYANAKAIVQGFLAEHMEYSVSPGKAFDGTGETLESIITGKGEGYSAHYASLAAILLRYYGIPTRYVEGYIITSADAKVMKDDEPYAIPMSQAHAWVEYYHDGVGWVPFEVTPGYEDMMDETKDSTESDSVNNPTEAPEHTENTDSVSPDEKEEVSFPEKLLFVLLALIALWFIARAAVLHYLYGERGDKNYAEAVKSCCRHTLRLLAALGYKPDGDSLYSLVPRLREVADEPLFAEKFLTLADLANKAAFSGEAITLEEAEAAREIFTWYTAYCGKTLSMTKRLWLRFGMWIY